MALFFARSNLHSKTVAPHTPVNSAGTWRYQRTQGLLKIHSVMAHAEGKICQKEQALRKKKNRKFESIVLFGVVWQVPKDQINKNVLRLFVSSPRYLPAPSAA